MTTPRPLRLALIGLSSTSPSSWLSLAHLPYLLSPHGLARYQIIALLNSSLSSAAAAISHYGLDPSIVRPYGSAEDLAQEREVDLVVVGTRVDVHYGNLKPLLEGWRDWRRGDGKGLRMGQMKKRGVYWGVRTVVGTQGWGSPVVKKIRDVLGSKEGKLGKVLSTELRISGMTGDREKLGEKMAYFAERKVGGNLWTIGGGHMIDLLQSLLGELKPESIKSHLTLQRPLIPLTDSSGAITKTITSNTPDLLYLTGSLPASPPPPSSSSSSSTPPSISSLSLSPSSPPPGVVPVQENATLHLRMRRGPPFPGEPAFVWSITCERGEVRVTSDDSIAIILGTGDVKIEVHDFETDEVEEVEWEWEDWQKELPGPARNVGSVYEGLWEAWVNNEEGGQGPKGEGKKRYNDWEVARRRHELVERAFVESGF
ncbi:hypothetical protein B0T20DRAFT_451180 [Sordaria brevicollis]|uniref:Gal80p-like C-terminal domain-containing protein n=1 Tax=Sordaria brevicollis TaxID=83679 RepID=A0AAE0PM11_SORBR|nr:hypothetical protein B0T20DRAFT_451180 [Sordaria brevicollis]